MIILMLVLSTLNIGGKDKPNSRERQKHDGKTSIKRLLRRMGVGFFCLHRLDGKLQKISLSDFFFIATVQYPHSYLLNSYFLSYHISFLTV